MHACKQFTSCLPDDQQSFDTPAGPQLPQQGHNQLCFSAAVTTAPLKHLQC
jgi:hypothetical protein